MGIMKTLTINGVKYDVTPVVPATSVTLLANAWVGSGCAYSQVVAVPGATPNTKVDLQPTAEQLEEFHYKILSFVAENEGGVVTVYCIGDKPKGDHTIQTTLTEVEASGKIRGNTVGTSMPKPDWNQTDPTKADYILNKPVVVKSVNGLVPDEHGNVVVQGGGGGSGEAGADGFSPIANVTQTDTGAVVTITDKSGTTTATIVNGKDGADGKDGAKGDKGDPGEKGDTGATGPQGIQGETGPAGEKGATGAKGEKGDAFTYADFTADQLAALKGEKGDKGDPGEKGEQGIQGVPGEKGEKGDTGAPGADGAKGDKGDKGDTGEPGATGSNGADGKTPVKGVDYYTEDDKAEFSAYIATELAKRGQLAPEYANSIEECTDTTKLYVLPDGMIYAYMLTEKEIASGGYTNLLPTAKAADRKTIYGEDYNGDGVADGYKNNTRLSSSGSETTNSSYTMASTGFIPAKENDILRIKGYSDGTQSCYINTYNASNTKVGNVVFAAKATATIGTDGYTYDESTGIHYVPLTSAKFGSGFNAVRVCFGSMDGAIFTINEEIKEGGTTIVKEYAWTSTGHAFVPADYEDRIVAVEKTASNHTARIVALEKSVESGGADETEKAALERIKVWDKPVYDPAPVTLIADNRVKPALTTSDRTIDGIYAKYRALMAAHPDYIKETNMGKSAGSSTFTAVDMLRFDFCEPAGLTQPGFDADETHETKPTLIFLSGIHNEWVGVWGLYYALEEITTNPDFDDVRRNARIVVIPCANPYGLVKPLGEYSVPSHVNANGVAIHNNFGVGWVNRGAVGEYNYSGTEPYSEPETQHIDAVMAEFPDAVAFISCHNNDYSTYYGSHVIWASSATYHMCNVAFRLVDKLTKAWLNKYGQTLKDSIDQYKINMDANDYRLGRACMSTSAGTEQLNATKYGIMGVNLEISRMMKVFSGDTDGTSEVMTHGAEVYANFMRTLLWSYDPKDKKEYAPNLPWSE